MGCSPGARCRPLSAHLHRAFLRPLLTPTPWGSSQGHRACSRGAQGNPSKPARLLGLPARGPQVRGFKQRTLILSQLWRPEPESRVPAGLVPSAAQTGSPASPVSQFLGLWAAPGTPWLVAASLQSPHPRRVFTWPSPPPCMTCILSFSYEDTCHGFRAPLFQHDSSRDPYLSHISKGPSSTP